MKAYDSGKASRQVNETFYDGEDAEVEVEYSFKLSGDFLPLESGAADDVDYIAEYLPYSMRNTEIRNILRTFHTFVLHVQPNIKYLI